MTLASKFRKLFVFYLVYKIFKYVQKRKQERQRRLCLEKLKAKSFHVAIIGAGMSGICMGIKLKQAGIPFTIFELSDKVGGTWLDNSYPGSGCDVPSHVYAYSFDVNTAWTKYYSERNEILAYFTKVAKDHGIMEHVKFNTRVEDMVYARDTCLWTLTYRGVGEHEESKVETFNVVVSATGQLNRPKIPSFKGIETFKGPAFHTARWRHDIDLKGKKVVGVGSGPSAIQAFPAIAQEVEELTVCMRTPTYMIPRGNVTHTPIRLYIQSLFPLLVHMYRALILGMADAFFLVAYGLDPTHRETLSRGSEGFRNACLKFMDMQLSQEVAREGDRAKIEKLKKALTPNFPPGCKRVGISDDWYPMFLRENVMLEIDAIDSVTPTGIVVRNKETNETKSVDADVIIWATGFSTTSFLEHLSIRTVKSLGNGVESESDYTLAEAWNDYPKAYYGMCVPGLPNFYMLYGPNTNLGHNSIIFMVECQVNYIVQLLQRMLERDCDDVEVKLHAFDKFNERLQKDLNHTVFTGNCSSWYKTEAGENTNNWAGTVFKYWLETLRPKFENFEFGRRK